jgi:hypothetical protein
MSCIVLMWQKEVAAEIIDGLMKNRPGRKYLWMLR